MLKICTNCYRLVLLRDTMHMHASCHVMKWIHCLRHYERERDRERDVLPSKCQNDIIVGNMLEIILRKLILSVSIIYWEKKLMQNIINNYIRIWYRSMPWFMVDCKTKYYLSGFWQCAQILLNKGKTIMGFGKQWPEELRR